MKHESKPETRETDFDAGYRALGAVAIGALAIGKLRVESARENVENRHVGSR